MNKLLIVEDDKGISNSLKLYLENSALKIELFYTGVGAVKKIVEGDYSAIILDVNLPGMDGIEICKNVREQSEIPIIMLTARTSEMDKVRGLEIGADDYIEKPFSPRELLARINVVLRRNVVNLEKREEVSNIINIGNIEINKNKKIVLVEKNEINLTKNEYDILVRICKENGNVVSRETLMIDVIGYEKYIYDRTLDTHIKNIRKKINNKGLILTVRGEGYRLNK
ncbi:MAG: response regulator transcription factor [Candidatus Gracilibacteria bacterium]|nr:response regulator transcription factor [Candidatus Gracilibacteria bacterium]MDQ7022627.1 response regulator transcription factor [Candidatus Gracilibacteria bacterium]